MNRNLETQMNTIDNLLRQKEHLLNRNSLLKQINYLVEQISLELEDLSPEKAGSIPIEISDKLFKISSPQHDSFETLVGIMKDIIKWKYSGNQL